jgi:8-oxo-dGTP pyrophosphatase MutT (NUDIX family)
MVKTFAKILLVNDRGELLILRRSDHDDHRPRGHDFPGGTVEAGEDPLGGVIRETQEETGIAIADPQLIFAAPRIGAYGTGTWLIYTARVPNDTPVQLSDEHTSYEWLTPEAALATCGYSNHEELLRFITEYKVLGSATPAGVTCRSLLVNPAGELLMLRRSSTDPFHAGAWDLPGGRVEPGERLADAAVRELAEETGIAGAKLTLVYGTSNSRREGTGSWLFYQANVPANTAIMLSDEHDEYQWIPESDLPKYTDYDVLLRMHAFVTTYRLYNGL